VRDRALLGVLYVSLAIIGLVTLLDPEMPLRVATMLSLDGRTHTPEYRPTLR
jgi:hypothetical protein